MAVLTVAPGDLGGNRKFSPNYLPVTRMMSPPRVTLHYVGPIKSTFITVGTDPPSFLPTLS
jgi:hypothetical protein